MFDGQPFHKCPKRGGEYSPLSLVEDVLTGEGHWECAWCHTIQV